MRWAGLTPSSSSVTNCQYAYLVQCSDTILIPFGTGLASLAEKILRIKRKRSGVQRTTTSGLKEMEAPNMYLDLPPIAISSLMENVGSMYSLKEKMC